MAFKSKIHESFFYPERGAAAVDSAYLDATPRRTTVGGHNLTRRLVLELLLLLLVSAMIIMGVYYQGTGFAADDNGPVISHGINLSREPLQKDTSQFKTTIRGGGSVATIVSDTSYSIRGRVEGTMPYEDGISDIVPYDLLLAWGDVTRDGADSKLDWEQSDRKGQVSGSLGGIDGVDLSADYIVSHISNNHIIPANENIRIALETIKPGDTVAIEGRLVNLRLLTPDDHVISVNTSKVRNDKGEGACEIIFAESLRINDVSF